MDQTMHERLDLKQLIPNIIFKNNLLSYYQLRDKLLANEMSILNYRNNFITLFKNDFKESEYLIYIIESDTINFEAEFNLIKGLRLELEDLNFRNQVELFSIIFAEIIYISCYEENLPEKLFLAKIENNFLSLEKLLCQNFKLD